MADEHVLLPRERYQRLLNKAEQKKESSDEKKKPKREVGASRKRTLVKKQVVYNVEKTEKKEDGSNKTREDRPPGVPISSSFKNWIRF